MTKLPPPPISDLARGDDLLTADELATVLRVTPAWVYAQTRGERIPHLRVGRYVRFRRSAILAWLAEIEAGRGVADAELRR
jgi:excisionase family DNA binding protein